MERPNKYNVIVSEQATKMLVTHAAFLARVNSDMAEQLVSSFETAANSLSTMPQRCPWLDGENIPRNTYRFLMFEKWYMLIFQIKDDTVYVDYTVDCRQDYSWLIG